MYVINSYEQWLLKSWVFKSVGQPLVCKNATCSNAERWALLRQESKFADWQRVRMQENSNEIPAGSLPRTLDIILRHEIVEIARAGDK
jgi:DNA replication licensing factor MCM6